jgi:hypothetical protein
VFVNKLLLSGGSYPRTGSTGVKGKKHNYRLLIFLSVLGFLAHNGYAIPVDGEVIMSGEEYFDTGSLYEPKRIDARVEYEVLGYGNNGNNDYDEYLYTYRVFNQVDSSVGLELFSVGIFEGADAYKPGFEFGLGDDEVAPTAIYVVGEPAQSVTSLFLLEPLDVGEYSTLLTFWSGDAPEMGYGTLNGGGISHVGGLPAPVPEPGSILLLAAGAMAALADRAAPSKRRK